MDQANQNLGDALFAFDKPLSSHPYSTFAPKSSCATHARERLQRQCFKFRGFGSVGEAQRSDPATCGTPRSISLPQDANPSCLPRSAGEVHLTGDHFGDLEHRLAPVK